MKVDEAKKLPHGLYKVFWKQGGMSLAAKGHRSDGSPWFAFTNWISPSTERVHRLIERVELVMQDED